MKLPVELPRYAHRPLVCIYFMCDTRGHVTYIGKSTNFDVHEHRLHEARLHLSMSPRRLGYFRAQIYMVARPSANVTYNPNNRWCRSPFEKATNDHTAAIRNLIDKEKL